MHPPDSFHPELETKNRKEWLLELCRDEIDNYEEYEYEYGIFNIPVS